MDIYNILCYDLQNIINMFLQEKEKYNNVLKQLEKVTINLICYGEDLDNCNIDPRYVSKFYNKSFLNEFKLNKKHIYYNRTQLMTELNNEILKYKAFRRMFKKKYNIKVLFKQYELK